MLSIILKRRETISSGFGSRRALGILLLLLAWVSGTAGLNLRLLRQGAGDVAIPFFLVACGLWIIADQILKLQGLGGRIAALVLILYWLICLGMAALARWSDIHKTPFFVVSVSATLLLLIFVGISLKSKPARGSLSTGGGAG